MPTMLVRVRPSCLVQSATRIWSPLSVHRPEAFTSFAARVEGNVDLNAVRSYVGSLSQRLLHAHAWTRNSAKPPCVAWRQNWH
jgi:hypothetical protein